MLERSKAETEQEEAHLDQSAVTLRQQIEGIAHNLQVGRVAPIRLKEA